MGCKKLKYAIRTSETLAVLDEACKLYAKFPALSEDPYLKEKYDSVKDYVQRAMSAMSREKSTSTLSAFDKARDESIRALTTLVHGYTSYPDDALKAAAALIEGIFSRYPNIKNESFVRQTALLDSLLSDFEEAAAKEALETLSGVSELFGNLKKSAEDFKKASSERNAALVSESSVVCASNLKGEMTSVFHNDILPYLEAMSKAKGGDYKSLFDLTEGEIESINSEITRRKTASINKRRGKVGE